MVLKWRLNELNSANVCHGNVCFKIPSILVKNKIDKVILGLPFINALYPFIVKHDGFTTDPFGQKVKFKFASKFEIDTNAVLNLIRAKTKHLNFLQQEVRYKKHIYIYIYIYINTFIVATLLFSHISITSLFFFPIFRASTVMLLK